MNMITVDQILVETELLEDIIPIRVSRRTKKDWDSLGSKLGRSRVYLRNDRVREQLQDLINQFNQTLEQILDKK